MCSPEEVSAVAVSMQLMTCLDDLYKKLVYSPLRVVCTIPTCDA